MIALESLNKNETIETNLHNNWKSWKMLGKIEKYCKDWKKLEKLKTIGKNWKILEKLKKIGKIEKNWENWKKLTTRQSAEKGVR